MEIIDIHLHVGQLFEWSPPAAGTVKKVCSVNAF